MSEKDIFIIIIFAVIWALVVLIEEGYVNYKRIKNDTRVADEAIETYRTITKYYKEELRKTEDENEEI